MFSFQGSLTDEHVLELSKRITGEEELLALGVNVLKLPDFVIKTVLYNKKEIQSATHEILSTWLKEQRNPREAYINLQTGLETAEMNQLAAVLEQSVKETEKRPTVTDSLSSIRTHKFDFSVTAESPSVQQQPTFTTPFSFPPPSRQKVPTEESTGKPVPSSATAAPYFGNSPFLVPSCMQQKPTSIKRTPPGGQSSISTTASKRAAQTAGQSARLPRR